MRTLWVSAALVLDVALYLMLRNAPGLRPEVIRTFAEVNVSLMALDLAITQIALRRLWRGYRVALVACVVCEALAATVWIQMTGSISSYFLIVGFLLILLYRLLFDYASGLACALAVVAFHCGAFALEASGVLRPASLFVAAPLGIYESPLFRASAMLSLVIGYGLTFVALNFFVSTLRDKEAALRTARMDLARAVDETQSQGRLCGQVLADTYELEELIGRGGMGEVYYGRRIEDGERVAVKVLHAHLIDRSGMRERFRREAMLVARLPAVHVAEVLECGITQDGQDFIVMEYLQGDDLAGVLRRRGKLSIDEVVSLVAKIATALEAAHAAGVVHRDLKPENVFLLEGSEDVRLLDFGIARLQEGDGLTLTTELLGTPGYMAPEQARGDATQIGPHTDVFALGAIIYRALTGKCPFPSRSAAAAVYEALNLTPAPPSTIVPSLPTDVDHVIALALAKRCNDRYSRPHILAKEIELAAQNALHEASRASARNLAIVNEDNPTVRLTHPHPVTFH